jgi:release factor glutamine methyltransferase
MTEPVRDATIGTLLSQATHRLSCLPTARLDAELLLAQVLGCDRVALIRDRDSVVEPTRRAAFNDLVLARAAERPLAQLRGTQEFWSLTLKINDNVLVPRSETELLVATALAFLPKHRKLRLADLGTGSGAVALAVARELPHATIIGLDYSAEALSLAKRNRTDCGLSNVLLVRGSWSGALQGNSFDVILANPPYVASDDPLLRDSGLRYEPLEALAAGKEGLDALSAIIAEAPQALIAGGWLMLEHGATQGASVRTLLTEAKMEAIATFTDLAGLERVSIGQKGA